MEGNAHLLQVIRKMRSQINKLERENRALRGELQVCGQRAVPPEGEAARGGGDSDVRSLATDGEGPAGSPASLHGSIVASPALAPKEQTGTKDPELSMAPMGAAHCLSCPVRWKTASLTQISGISMVGVQSCSEGDEGLNSASDLREAGQGLQLNTTMTVRRYPTASPTPSPSRAGSHQDGKREEKGLVKTPANCPSYSHSSKMKLFQEHVCKCRSKVKAVSFLLPMDMSAYAEKPDSLKSPQNQSTKQLTTIAEKDM
ncbi:putative coiled-coil domain-containing protein 195 [Podargus strigoides]